MPARALLLDFGGVLTTSVFESFAAFSRTCGLPDDAVRSALVADEAARRLLVEAETDRISEAEFNRRFAAALGEAHGIAVPAEDLVGQLNRGLRPVKGMVDVTTTVRAAGVPTVLVSNSLGYGAYEMLELDSLFDAQILSGKVGIRKPSRAIYAMGAEAAGVAPDECVMVDDLEQNLSGAARLGIEGILHTDAATTATALERHFGIKIPSPVER